MIVIDSSAVVAVLFEEADAARYGQVFSSNTCRMSAMSVYETEIVIMGRTQPPTPAIVRIFLATQDVQIVPFDDAQAQFAFAAYARFGKGVHPARLNMGDCAAYALAQSLNAPLLYKGDDFARTDVASALTTG